MGGSVELAIPWLDVGVEAQTTASTTAVLPLLSGVVSRGLGSGACDYCSICPASDATAD